MLKNANLTGVKTATNNLHMIMMDPERKSRFFDNFRVNFQQLHNHVLVYISTTNVQCVHDVFSLNYVILPRVIYFKGIVTKIVRT